MEKIQYTNNQIIIYGPDSLKFIIDQIPNSLNHKLEEYKKLFDINEFRKVELHYFDNQEEFRNYIYHLRGEKESLPQYAKATFDDGKIIMYVNPKVLINSPLYQHHLSTPAHELFHIMYQELIWQKNNLERVVWFDEGMAQYFSGESNDKLDDNHFNDFLNQVEQDTKEIPNLNQLSHGASFENERYHGYDLSLLSIKYLIDTLGIDEFKQLMKNIPQIKSYGDNIVMSAFAYYENKDKILK